MAIINSRVQLVRCSTVLVFLLAMLLVGVCCQHAPRLCHSEECVSTAGVLGPVRGIGRGRGLLERIVGGTEASIQDAPWQVALQYKGEFSCGGSIIRDTVILTAAHCTIETSAGAWNVRAGSSRHESGGTSHKVSKITTHPSFNPNLLDYDVAVMFLSSAISIDNLNTRLIPLPTFNQHVATGARAFVTGWGSTSDSDLIQDTLQKVTVPVVAQATCVSAYSNFTNTVTARMICGGQMEVGGVDACHGDSGGPFVVNGVIVGITSWGNGCGLAAYPGVYARVPVLVDWINGQL